MRTIDVANRATGEMVLAAYNLIADGRRGYISYDYVSYDKGWHLTVAPLKWSEDGPVNVYRWEGRWVEWLPQQ